MYPQPTFSDFHSVPWCNQCYKCHSKSLKQYQCNQCHNMLIGPLVHRPNFFQTEFTRSLRIFWAFANSFWNALSPFSRISQPSKNWLGHTLLVSKARHSVCDTPKLPFLLKNMLAEKLLVIFFNWNLSRPIKGVKTGLLGFQGQPNRWAKSFQFVSFAGGIFERRFFP